MRPLIYTVMDTATAVSTDTALPVGTIQRRVGCDIVANSNSYTLRRPSYYDIDANVVMTAGAAGIATLSINQDGSTIATTQQTVASGETVTLNVKAIARVFCRSNSTIQLVVNGATVSESVIGSYVAIREE